MEISRAIKERCSSHWGYHIALNHLSLLGKRFSNSLEDILIEPGLYAAGTTTTLILGRSYSRGIREHKLTMEELFRLLRQVLVKWLKSQSTGHTISLLSYKGAKHPLKERKFTQQSCYEVVNGMGAMKSLLTIFKAKAKSKSSCSSSRRNA